MFFVELQRLKRTNVFFARPGTINSTVESDLLKDRSAFLRRRMLMCEPVFSDQSYEGFNF